MGLFWPDYLLLLAVIPCSGPGVCLRAQAEEAFCRPLLQPVLDQASDARLHSSGDGICRSL